MRVLSLLLSVTLWIALSFDGSWAQTQTHPCEPTDLLICGTGDSQRLFRRLAEAFEHIHPEIQINVPMSIGSSGGIKAVAAGKCDFGRVARPLNDKEKRYGLYYLAIAQAPVVFVANESVEGITDLSEEEVVGIYSGTITDWQKLGGTAGKIYVANREKGDASRSVIEEKVPAFNEIESFAGKIIYTTPETIAIIVKHEGTVGYTNLTQIEHHEGLKVFTFADVAPTTDHIQAGRYPLLIPLGLVWSEGLGSAGREFLKFLSSPEAREVMFEHGTVPISNGS